MWAARLTAQYPWPTARSPPSDIEGKAEAETDQKRPCHFLHL